MNLWRWFYAVRKRKRLKIMKKLHNLPLSWSLYRTWNELWKKNFTGVYLKGLSQLWNQSSLVLCMSISIPDQVQVIKFSRTFAVTGIKFGKICAENYLFSEGLTIFSPKVNWSLDTCVFFLSYLICLFRYTSRQMVQRIWKRMMRTPSRSGFCRGQFFCFIALSQ